jgi:hypothetical protein
MADLYTEMGIESLVQVATAELGKKRQQTMIYTHISSEGAVTVDVTNPGLIALQAEISAIESKLSTVAALKDQVSALVSGHGVGTIRALRDLSEHHQNTINSAPVRAFDLFKMKRELAIEQGNAAVRLAMPSEIPALLDGYQAEEDALKAGQTAAQEALVSIAADLTTIAGLTDEAKAALRA